MPYTRLSPALVAVLVLAGCGDSRSGRIVGPDAAGDDAEVDASTMQPDADVDGDAAGDADAHGDPDACVPATETCNDVDDDCDGMIDETLRIACLVDADGDHHAISKDAVMLCPEAARADYGECPVGYQTAASPGMADCDDTNPVLHGNVRIRMDTDQDGYCTGPTTTPCGPSTPAAPYRREAQCAVSTDCKDDNPYATTFCFVEGAFSTTSRNHVCGVGGGPTANAFLTPISACPTGFHPVSFYPVSSAPSAVACTASSASASGATITQTCVSTFGEATCRVVADCIAN